MTIKGKVRDEFSFLLKDPLAASIYAILSGALLIFIVYPIASVLIQSIFSMKILTFKNYLVFFSSKYHYRALVNSLLLATSSTVITTFLAFVIAFMVNRGPLFLRGPLRILTISPLVTPPFVFALALIILGGRQGLITKFLNINFSIFGWFGMVTSQVLHFIPLCFIMIDNVLLSLNPNLEESAEDMGADQFTILRTITIPLVSPGLLKAALLVFILSMADFGNPALIGGGRPFLAVDAYLLVIGENNMEMASVFCVFLTIPSLIIYIIHRYLIKEKAYTTIGGKPGPREKKKMSLAIEIPMLIICFLVSFIICLVFAVIIGGAFTKIIGIDHTLTWQNFAIKGNLLALRNSVLLSFYAALMSAVGGTILSYLLVRKPIPGRSVLEFISLSGFAIPGTVVGIGYILTFKNPPFLLIGTATIVVLSMIFRTIAVGVEAGISKLYQVDPEIEEASLDLGAGFLRTFWRVVLPIMFSAFFGGLVFAFIYSMNTISAVIFLTPPKYMLASLRIFQSAEQGRMGEACAVSVFLILAVIFSLSILYLFSRKMGIRVFSTVG